MHAQAFYSETFEAIVGVTVSRILLRNPLHDIVKPIATVAQANNRPAWLQHVFVQSVLMEAEERVRVWRAANLSS